MSGSEIIVFLSSNLPKAMNAISAVTGALFTAIFLRHNTSASEFEKIKAGLFKEVADDLLKSGKMTYTEYYKANNFLEIAKKADKYYSKENHIRENVAFDFDWFVRLYEAAGNVSDKGMQDYWARILSGEVSNKGRFSLQTIDILKNIGKEDALLFEKICNCLIHLNEHVFIPNYDSYLDACKISYSDVMRLDELGLINSNGMLVLNLLITTNNFVLFRSENLIITARAENSTEMKIKQFPLTNAGKEISSIIPILVSDEYITVLAKELSKNASNVIIELHKIIEESGNQVQYNVKNLLNDAAYNL